MENKPNNTKFNIFGDESINKNIYMPTKPSVIVYSIILVKENILQNIEKSILDLYEEYEIPCDFIMHCKIFFHGSRRKKNKSVKHLNLTAIFELYKKYSETFRNYNIPIISCIADRSILPNEILIGETRSSGGIIVNPKEEIRSIDDYTLLNLCKNTCFIPLLKYLDQRNLVIYLDKNTSKFIDTITLKRSKFDSTANMFLDTGNEAVKLDNSRIFKDSILY